MTASIAPTWSVMPSRLPGIESPFSWTAAIAWSPEAAASVAAPAPISTGATISPAPWAVDIRNDHHVSSRRLTVPLTQRKCARGLMKRNSPNAISATPAPRCSADGSVMTPSPSTSSATSRIDASWPIAIAGSARSTAPRSRSCIPSATANSQPMAGLSPWYAPSSPSRTQGQTASNIR